jgi:hypothetical protein
MSVINEIFRSILETLSSIHLYFYDNLTMIFLITLWIFFFRYKLKFNIALTTAGLLLGHVVSLIADDLVYQFLINELEIPLQDAVIDIWSYSKLALWFILFYAFVRVGWSKALLVYCVSRTVIIISDHSTNFIEAGVSAAGLPSLNYPFSLIDYVVLLIIAGIAQYRLLAPRLQRLESRDMKWLWIGHAAFYVVYDIGLTFFVNIYNRRNNFRVDPQDPVFLFFVVQFVILFILVFALTLVIMDNISKNALLRSEAVLKDRLLDLQREQYQRITENAGAVKAQRHDLRHQLAVVKHYNDSGDAESLGGYLDELMMGIPAPDDQALCENFAVNAVAHYYYSLSVGAGIETSVQLSVPQNTGRVRDSDLCIIVGNLFENAIEACGRQTSGQRFVQMNIHIRYDTLTITMDNSFDGNYNELDGVFFSLKRDGEGMGLSSVRAVACKYEGNAKFEVKGNVFMSSAYVDIREPAAALACVGDEAGA